MLSSYSAATVGFVGDGFVIHDHCARERYSALTVEKAEAGLANTADLSPLSRYSAESEWPEGLSCDHCHEWIVEPSEENPAYGPGNPDWERDFDNFRDAIT